MQNVVLLTVFSPLCRLKGKGDSFPVAPKPEAKNDKLSLTDAVIRTDSPLQPPLKRESNLGTANEAAKLKVSKILRCVSLLCAF